MTPPAGPPRVLIVASGLRGITGHTYGYTETVRHALEAQGCAVTVFGHRNLPRELHAPHLKPVFTVGCYDVAPGNGPWPDLAYIYAQSVIHQSELRRALRGEHYDLVFCHTIVEFELLSWARLAAGGGLDGRLVVLLRNTPGWSRSPRWKRTFHPYWRLRPSTLARLRRALGERFTLMTDSEVLSEDYRRIYPHRIVTLPLPLGERFLAEPPAPASREPLRVGYLGDSRAAKGFSLLPEVVRRVLAARPGRVHFALQCAYGEYDVEPPRGLAELEELERRHPAEVKLWRGALPEPAYAEALRGLDLVLLPYNDRHFDEGTSNVFAEATAAGRPVVVPRGSWMERELQKAGAGTTFERGDPASLATACLEALEDHPRLVGRAAETSAAWRAFHNPQALARELLRGAGLG